MNLYIIRHGKTVWNEKRRTQGRVHNRLSKQGILFSSKVADELKDVKFDFIFSSPLLRAVQTANIINKHHGKKIIKDDRLIDIDQGVFTGRFFDSLTDEELTIKKSRDKNYGMESLKEMFYRVKDFYSYLKTHFSNTTILVVTHSGVATFLSLVIDHEEFDPKVFNRTDLFDNSQIKQFLI